jgi:hypothetical protein
VNSDHKDAFTELCDQHQFLGLGVEECHCRAYVPEDVFFVPCGHLDAKSLLLPHALFCEKFLCSGDFGTVRVRVLPDT